jgi:hypothetical protein
MVLFMPSCGDAYFCFLTDFLAFGHSSVVLACKLLASFSCGERQPIIGKYESVFTGL